MSAYRFLRTLWPALLLAALLLAIRSIKASAQEPDPATLEQGAKLYAENCAVCHGANGQGRIGAQLDKDWTSVRPELTVRSIIENGIQNSVMPAWSRAKGGPLGEADIDALVTYILSWQTGGYPQITSYPRATPFPPITPVAEVSGRRCPTLRPSS